MATRNPHDLVHVARDLITLRAVMEWFSAEVPEWIQIAFDRLVPFVKSMAHGDHRLAHFNGAYEGREEDLDEILNLSRAKGRAISMAPHTGYQRLKRKRTLLLVDVGPPPPPLEQLLGDFDLVGVHGRSAPAPLVVVQTLGVGHRRWAPFEREAGRT